MQYNKINNLLGWLCFIIASATYISTLEPSVSFWDCGEFISCAYRLQVAHQPGYPLFAMLGKFFSLFSMGDKTKVSYFTNMGSALASGTTIMFLFWTITAFFSIALAFMNILPIPALDGGHVLFTLLEMITGRKPSQKLLEYAQVVGMVLILALVIYVNGNDWFGWGKGR